MPKSIAGKGPSGPGALPERTTKPKLISGGSVNSLVAHLQHYRSVKFSDFFKNHRSYSYRPPCFFQNTFSFNAAFGVLSPECRLIICLYFNPEVPEVVSEGRLFFSILVPRLSLILCTDHFFKFSLTCAMQVHYSPGVSRKSEEE